jgi:hypothetical protein
VPPERVGTRHQRPFSPAARASGRPDPSRVLVIGCGALARELVAVIDQAGLDNVDLTCLPATLHNRPGGIPEAVRARIRAARPRYDNIFIAYADCGTGGVLDRVLAEERVERLPGAHCYEFYSGSHEFAAMMDEEPGTFFLTDFLARNFERLVWVGLGLDRHRDLLPVYFGAYKRVVYLAQTDDPTLATAGRRAARRLGLAFEIRRTGYGDLASSVIGAAQNAGNVIAPAANKSLPGGLQRSESASPLRVAQTRGGRDPERADGLREPRETSPLRSSRRRCLAPTQRRIGPLRGGQIPEADRPAGVVSVTSAAPGQRA